MVAHAITEYDTLPNRQDERLNSSSRQGKRKQLNQNAEAKGIFPACLLTLGYVYWGQLL